MKRRAFLVATGALLMVPRAALAQPVAEDWDLFKQLAGVFRSLTEATDPIANGITQLKFMRLLNGIHAPLFELLHEKLAILSILKAASCTGDRQIVISVAGAAADRIIPLVNTLSRQTTILAGAVKPSGTRDEAAKIADRLLQLQTRKMWTNRVKQFCGQNPAQRAGFVTEVEQSIAIVRQCRDDLDRLINKLN